MVELMAIDCHCGGACQYYGVAQGLSAYPHAYRSSITGFGVLAGCFE